jgi:acyl carrier protein
MRTDRTTPERAEILALVLGIVQEAIALAGSPPPAPRLDEQTVLLGPAAALDSLGLVTLIVDLEQQLEEQYDTTVDFAHEQAMSGRQSPFRTIGTLTDYVCRALRPAG